MNKLTTLLLFIFISAANCMAQTDCKKSTVKFVDKFTDEIKIRTTPPSFGSKIFGGKRFDKNGALIASELYFNVYGPIPPSESETVNLILEDGTKLELPISVITSNISTTIRVSQSGNARSTASYNYIAVLTLNDQLWKTFTEHQITDFRINGSEEKIKKSVGETLQQRLICLKDVTTDK